MILIFILKAKKIKKINQSFTDDSGIIWCAAGGDSCFGILDHIKYGKIISNKLLIGSSDNIHLILAVYLKTGLSTVFGPNIVNLPSLDRGSVDSLFEYIRNIQDFKYPSAMEIIKPGDAEGALFGGNLFALNNILEKYPTDKLNDLILFFEDIEDEVIEIGREIRRLKTSPILNKIKALVIGNIVTQKTKETVIDIIRSEFCEFDFPIIKVNYFGHQTKIFYPIPIGKNAHLDTSQKVFCLRATQKGP